MLLDFEKQAIKGNEFLRQLETNLGVQDRSHAARILRSTFRVLRNHLTLEESLQLLAQLPMAIKSVYVDGWALAAHRKLKTVEELIAEIAQSEGQAAWRDFSDKEEVLTAVRAVIRTMGLYVSPEEMAQAIGTLPGRIQKVLIADQLA